MAVENTDNNIGVLPKLNDPLLPWQQRIKVARHALTSDDCVIPNKRQVLLGWVCQQLVDFYKKRRSCSLPVLKDLWEYLDSILDSINCCKKQKDSRFSLTLMPQLLQVFIELFSSGFDKNDIASVQLQCAQMILSNSKLNIAFTAKFDIYVLFISSLSTTFVNLLDQTRHDNEITIEAFSLLEISLNLYIPLQRRQTNHKKLFERVCQHLVGPLVSVCLLLKNTNHLQRCTVLPLDRMDALITQLHQALSDALFRKEHLPEYSTSLKTLDHKELSETDTLEPKAKKARVGNYTKELFETLRKHCLQHKDHVSYKAITNFLPQLFVEFLKARRHNNLGAASLEFDFFKEMCSLLGVCFTNESCAVATPNTLGLVYSLLDALLSYDVYQVADDNANNEVQFKWFNCFAEFLLKTPSSHNVFQCLQVLLQLNHYIVEPHLSTVLQHCWNDDDTQVDNKMSSQDTFLSSLVKTYAKLRQFDKFINQLLKSLQTIPNVSEEWQGLPKGFKEELIKACKTLPYGLATSLWKSFNKEILHTYIPSLPAVSEKENKTSKVEEQNIYRFERVVGLFRVFILNTSLGGVVEQHKTNAIITNLSDLSLTSNTEVLGPIFDVLPSITDHKLNVSLCTSALAFYHALQQMNIFLHKFGFITTDSFNDAATLHCDKHVSSYLKHDGQNKHNERLRYVKVLIAIQRLRMDMRSTSSCYESERNELISIVFHWLDTSSCDYLSVWNQELWSVNNSTFRIAYWFTLCNNAPIILTVCSDQYRQHFIQYLIQTLLSESHDHETTLKSDLTLQSISKALLNSAAFHQIPSIQKHFMVTLWHEVGQCLSSSSDSHLHKALLKVLTSLVGLDGESSDGKEADTSSSEEDNSEDESSSNEGGETAQGQSDKINKTPSTITPLVTTGKILDKALHQVSSSENLDVLQPELARVISQHISLLLFLPLDWLTDLNHVGCVLGLLACDALADKQQESSKESLRVLLLGRRLLIILLNGCISRKRYLVHHIISMDCLHLYLLSGLNSTDTIKGNVDVNQLQHVSFELLSVVMRYTLKTASPVESFMEKLIKDVDSLTNKLTSSESKKSAIKSLRDKQCFLRVCGTVMNILEQVIACKISRLSELKMAVHLSSQLTPPILALLEAIIQNDNKKTKQTTVEDKDNDLTVVLGDSPVLIDVYTGVVHVYCISQTSRKFSRYKEEFQTFPWQPILTPFLRYAVDSIVLTKEHSLLESHINDENKQQSLSHVTPTTSSLRFLDVIMSSVDVLDLDLPGGFHSHLLASILNFLNHLDSSHDRLKSMALDVVSSLLQGCSSEMAVSLLNGLSSELSLQHTNSSPRLSTCLQVWLMLLSGKFAKLRKTELRAVLPQVLIALQSIVQQSTNVDLGILTLELMAKILSLGTSMVHSHHCSLVFHGSLLEPLDHNNERFPVLFHTQFSLLSTVLFHQSEAVYKAVHVFVTCVKNMLNSLCHYCNGRTCDKSMSERTNHQLNCAEKMSRLYQEIATHKASLSKYIPYMIAEYIHRLQQVSLQEKIKKVLVPGIYCLLDSCGEHEMALLHAVLDKGSRQLFTSLNDDYNKFYKFKGKA